MAQCSICLSNFRDPVCIPCGHVYCKRCLTDYANAPGNNRLTAKCPDCRTSFDLVVPDLTYLPEKYHKFVSPNVRRVYVDFSSANKELRESLKATEDRLARKTSTEEALLRRCEELTEALNVHRQGERDANQRILELQDDNAHMEKLLEENDNSAKEILGIHRLTVDKVKCLEKSNQVLQQENVRLSLNYHDTGTEFLKDKEWLASIRADTVSNQTTYLSPSQSPNTSSVAFRPKQKQRKYVVHGPSSEDTPVPVSVSKTNSSASSRSMGASRPIKPLPKRRRAKNRLLEDSSFIPIGLSDFV